MVCTRPLVGALMIVLGLTASATAAELVTLSPENYQEYTPQGKEVDAIFGDYVLRNDEIVAVVADPGLMIGRSGSRKYGPIPDGIIDLTLREAPNDLLRGFNPVTGRGSGPDGKPGEPHRQKDFVDEAEAHKRPGRQDARGRRVTLTFPYKAPVAEVRYMLEDGWSYVIVEIDYRNASEKPLAVNSAMLDLGSPFSDMRKHAKRPENEALFRQGLDAAERLAWAYEPWFGQAYGVVGLSHAIDVLGSGLYPVGEDGKKLELKAGEHATVSFAVIPASDAFIVRAIAASIAGRELKEFKITAADSQGPVADALVFASQGGKEFAAGRTDPRGALEVKLPEGEFDFRILAPGRQPQTAAIDTRKTNSHTFQLEPQAVVTAEITDESGEPIAAKVEFRGREGTPDPFFFPDTGEHLVKNLYYTHDGRLRVIVPPGKYEAIITHGPEYDAVVEPIEVEAGRETALKAMLTRVVDTSGWISAEFANRSTVSRSFGTASQRGRVLNLLAEHVEFAPPTERDFISEFASHLEALNASDQMATCPGIGLTQRVRKAWTAQNAFPVIHRPGAQDGGALQRPQHVLQVFWLGGWDGPLTRTGNSSWTAGADKLIQITPPGIWINDGRSEGMYQLFYPRLKARISPQRDSRYAVLRSMDAMEIQPLDSFLNLPKYDLDDPKGEKDLQAWWKDLDDREAKHWPEVKDRNRDWLRMLNVGYQIAGVVNNNGYYNHHGSGHYRNWIKSPTDDPAKLKPEDVIKAVRFGHSVMSTGPFLDVKLKAGDSSAIPGDEALASGGRASLAVRIQSPNWIDVDRVRVLFNGFPAPQLDFNRKDHPDRFAAGVVKFDQVIPLDLKVDTHVMVLATGSGPNLRERSGPEDTTRQHVALSNPIWVDVDGDGFKPHSPLDDQVHTFLELVKPTASQSEGSRKQVRLHLKNLGSAEARDELSVEILPAGAARLVGENRYAYTLAPGQAVKWDFDVALEPGFEGPAISLHIPRSTESLGRRPVGLVIKLREETTGPQRRSVARDLWLPEHDTERPPNWEGSPRVRAAR